MMIYLPSVVKNNTTTVLRVYFLAVLSTEYNRILIFKEPVSNKALRGHVIRTEKVSDEGSCRVKCFMEPNCVSLNVGPSDEGTRTCDLNNATDESIWHSGLVDRPRYTYYGVEVFFLDRRYFLLYCEYFIFRYSAWLLDCRIPL